jgi:hypothetical protein
MLKGYTHITLLIDSSGSMEAIRDATIDSYNKFVADQQKVKGKCTLSHYEFASGSKKQYKSARLTRYLVGYLPEKPLTQNPYPILWNNQQPSPPNAPIPLLYGGATIANVQSVTVGQGQLNNVGQCIPNIPPSIISPTVEPQTTGEFSCVESFVDIAKAQVLNREIYVPHNFTPLLDSIGRAIYETGEHLAALPEAQRPEKVLFVIITDGAENASIEYSKDDIKTVIEHQTTKYGWDFIFLGANMDAVATGTSFGIASGMSVNFAATDASVTCSTETLSSKVSVYRSAADVNFAKSSLNYSDADRIVSLGGVTSNTVVNS